MKLKLKSVLMISLSALIFGCSAKTGMNESNLGTLKENPEVTKLYTSSAINPDYNYYYYGREIQPDTIMGISKDYTVQSKFWHPIQLTKEQLEHWVTWGERSRDDRCASGKYLGSYQGSEILDPSGTIIGNWYSKRDWGIFEFPGNNTLVPHPPRNKESWSLETCT